MDPLSHSPADILRWLLIEADEGSNPSGVPARPWPVFVAVEPTNPTNLVTLYDTAAHSDGRAMKDGELFCHYGFQVKVRALTHVIGYAKAEQIRQVLASVYQELVGVDSVEYTVQNIAHIGGVISLGQEPNSNRMLFTLNALAVIVPAGVTPL